MPLAVPPELKSLKPFLKRAEELDASPDGEARLVAYYCRQMAIEKGLGMLSTACKEAKRFLMR